MGASARPDEEGSVGTERAAAGIDAWYAAHGARCLGLALAMTRNQREAEGVVQDAFLAVWQCRDRLGANRPDIRTRLLMTTHHLAVDMIRCQPDKHHRAFDVEQFLRAVPATGPGPETRSEAVDSGYAIRSALIALSPPQREALVLAYFGGYTYAAIAAETELPVTTVRALILTAMRFLHDASATGNRSSRMRRT